MLETTRSQNLFSLDNVESSILFNCILFIELLVSDVECATTLLYTKIGLACRSLITVQL